LRARRALDNGDPRAIWVDASGVLLNLASDDGGPSALASGTTSGGFSTLLTMPSGTLVNAGANGSDVYFANASAGLDAPAMEQAPRSGGRAVTLGSTDPSFTGLALGTSTIYEATLSGISSMPAAGGAMTVIHSGGSALNLMVSSDGASLYWITGNFLGPYYIRTTSLDGAFTATTVATMPDYTTVSSMAVGGGQVVILGTSASTTASGFNSSLYIVSSTGGTPVAVDTVALPSDGGAAPKPQLAIANGAAYYSLGAGLKKVALDGSNAVSTVAAATSVISGIGANPSGDGAVYVVGQCVYAAP
jgi:hypothetical protein